MGRSFKVSMMNVWCARAIRSSSRLTNNHRRGAIPLARPPHWRARSRARFMPAVTCSWVCVRSPAPSCLSVQTVPTRQPFAPIMIHAMLDGLHPAGHTRVCARNGHTWTHTPTHTPDATSSLPSRGAREEQTNEKNHFFVDFSSLMQQFTELKLTSSASSSHKRDARRKSLQQGAWRRTTRD